VDIGLGWDLVRSSASLLALSLLVYQLSTSHWELRLLTSLLKIEFLEVVFA